MARRIIPDYLRLGPSRFVTNADVQIRSLCFGDNVLPIVYQEATRRKEPTCDICSPWSHYVQYPIGEVRRHRKGVEAAFRKILIAGAMPVLHVAGIDHVVSVNNWLISTNPPVELDPPALRLITASLCQEFPDRAILFRTVNPTAQPDLPISLAEAGYQLVANRVVYIMDPTSKPYRKSVDIGRDRKVLNDGKYEIVPHCSLTRSDMPRLAELHRLLYVQKHSSLNAEYTSLFFETAWRNRFLEFQALRKDGCIDGFTCWFELNGFLVSSLTGYDTTRPIESALYRRVCALGTEEARRRQMPINLSAGAGRFKLHRASRPSVEYDAVFDRHLPAHRRGGWALLKAAGTFQNRKVQRGW